MCNCIVPAPECRATQLGCCAMCKDRLAKDATARTGIDPVTKKPVDKATAFIAKAESGAAQYFESEKTFAAYTQSLN